MFPNRPDIARADHAHRPQEVGFVLGAGTVHNVPAGITTRRRRGGAGGHIVLDALLCVIIVAVSVLTHGPDITRAGRRNRIEVIAAIAIVGAGHDRPNGAVPVLGQGLLIAVAIILAHRPDVVGRYRR